MADISIKITKDGDVSQGAAPQDSGTQLNAAGQKPSPKQKASPNAELANITKAMAVNTITQAAQFGLSQFGNLTGNYRAQENMQTAVSTAMLAYGLMTANPIALVAGITQIAGKAISSQIDTNNTNRENEAKRQRLGRISTKGSRY